MSILDTDHLTKTFVKLVNRITDMICYDISREEIAKTLLAEGFEPNDIKFAFYAACIKFEDLGNSPLKIK